MLYIYVGFHSVLFIFWKITSFIWKITALVTGINLNACCVILGCPSPWGVVERSSQNPKGGTGVSPTSLEIRMATSIGRY